MLNLSPLSNMVYHPRKTRGSAQSIRPPGPISSLWGCPESIALGSLAKNPSRDSLLPQRFAIESLTKQTESLSLKTT